MCCLLSLGISVVLSPYIFTKQRSYKEMSYYNEINQQEVHKQMRCNIEFNQEVSSPVSDKIALKEKLKYPERQNRAKNHTKHNEKTQK